jgi:hypothetical protein
MVIVVDKGLVLLLSPLPPQFWRWKEHARPALVNDVTFVRVTLTIGGCDAVKEFVAYVMYSLASSFDFRDVTVGTTAESKVKIPLPIFLVEPVAAKDAGHFLAKVETDAARILGSFRPKEHDALMTRKASKWCPPQLSV